VEWAAAAKQSIAAPARNVLASRLGVRVVRLMIISPFVEETDVLPEIDSRL